MAFFLAELKLKSFIRDRMKKLLRKYAREWDINEIFMRKERMAERVASIGSFLTFCKWMCC